MAHGAALISRPRKWQTTRPPVPPRRPHHRGRLQRKGPQLPRWLDVGLRGIKYLLLLFFLWSILWAMPPESVAAFVYSDYNKIADVRLLDFFLHPSGLALGVIGVLVVLALPVRNPFCRFLCPYGALVGLISMLSPVKVSRDKKTCVSCGVCTQVCPSYIPVMRQERVSSEECIGCWRCISHCRAEGTLAMKLTGHKTEAVYRRYAIVSNADLRDAHGNSPGGIQQAHRQVTTIVPTKKGAAVRQRPL